MAFGHDADAVAQMPGLYQYGAAFVLSAVGFAVSPRHAGEALAAEVLLGIVDGCGADDGQRRSGSGFELVQWGFERIGHEKFFLVNGMLRTFVLPE